jgi:acyl-CoA thioester hydrolase
VSPILTYRGTVYPWHCDQVGHMNVMHYAGKFDEASWSMLLHLGISRSFMQEEDRGMAALSQTTNYKRELFAGDVVEIRTEVLEIGEKKLRLLHVMTNVETGEVAATNELLAVHLDRKLRKACAFPEAVRAAAERLVQLEDTRQVGWRPHAA